jgi:hypothetical protein
MKLAIFLPFLVVSFETTHAEVARGEGGNLRFLALEDLSFPSDPSLSVGGIVPVGSGKSDTLSNVGSTKAKKSVSMSISKAGKSASMSIPTSAKAGKSAETCSLSFEPDKANAERFHFTKSISVNEGTCDYMGVIEFNAPKANLDSAAILALYDLGDKFKRTTGFDHIALDYYPAGHPNMSNWGKSHFDFHLMRITPKERECMPCDIATFAPICDFMSPQSKPSGKKYFIMGRVETAGGGGMIANMPENFEVDIGSAVPGSGIHAYDFENAPLVADWTNPVLIMGGYDGGITFWEPMIPYSFASGTEE